MKPIKFRVWDAKAKQMLYPDAIAIYDEGKEYKSYFTECIGVHGTDDTLHQFTGLKDKKGKEIYEGDLVGFKYDGAMSIGTIIWNLCSWQLDYGDGNDTLCEFDGNKIQVVGNIFENPELILNDE